MFPLLRRMAATLHRPRVRRIAVNEFLALSDLALQDIGIHRSQIRSVVEDLLQGTESLQARPEPDAEAHATIANVRTPFACDREHRDAA